MQPEYTQARPVQEQIQEGIRKMIITYAIPGGEKLPAVRELASKLAVNPNAVMQAYQELLEKGYVCRNARQELVAASKEQVEELRRQDLFREFDRIVTGLSRLSVGTEELTKRVTELAGGCRGVDRSK